MLPSEPGLFTSGGAHNQESGASRGETDILSPRTLVSEGKRALPYRAEPNSEGSYVRLTLAGQLKQADLEAARTAAGRLLADRGWRKLFIDASGVETDMSVLDHFEFTAGHDEHLPSSLQTAIFHGPGDPTTFKFIETVGVNRGMNMRRFEQESEALDWLVGD